MQSFRRKESDSRKSQEKVSFKDCRPPPPPPDETPRAMVVRASKYLNQKTEKQANVSHERSGTGSVRKGHSLTARRRGSGSVVAVFVSCSCSGGG